MLLSFQEMPSYSLRIMSEATMFLVRGLPFVVFLSYYLKRLPWQGVDYYFIRLQQFQFYHMHKCIITLLILLAIARSKVIYLDDSNYTSFMSTHSYVFVKFYKPECRHCITMAEDYQKLAQASTDKEYVIAQVDVNIAKDTQRQLQIKRYPALKFIVHGHIFEYAGERKTQAMQNWIDGMMVSGIKEISKDQGQNVAEQHVVVIEGGSKQQLRILSFAQKINQIPYYHFDSDQLSITLYLQNSKRLSYSGDITIKRVSDWIALKLKGHLVVLKNPQIIQQVFQNKQYLPVLLLIKNSDFTADNMAVLSTFCQAAQKQLKCGYANKTHEIYSGLYSFLKLNDTEHSFLIWLDYQIRIGYQVPHPTSITVDSLNRFIEEVRGGKVDKYYEQQSSKKQPQFQYSHVVKLTAQNFNKTIQSNKYVFVQYYSTNCKYCVQFAAEYDKLAQKLKQEKSQYIIAAVDIDQQQQIRQQVKINGYPTFRFYAQTVELQYQGDRNAQSIIAYMNSVQSARLKTISNISHVARPSIVIYGIPQDSIFHMLPLIYTRYPVYQFIGSSPFKVEIHEEKKHSAIYGQQEIQNIANWLEEETEPTVINVVGSANSKKLSTAFEEHGPLLILINRNSSSEFYKVYRVFEKFCTDKVEYLCGIASKQQLQFQDFDEWVGGQNKSGNSLMYVTTQKFEKYMYEGELGKLTTQRMENFIRNIKDGKIKPMGYNIQAAADKQQQNNDDNQDKAEEYTINAQL